MPVNVRRLNHIVLFVSDLHDSELFYRDILGLEVHSRRTDANAVFLRVPDGDNVIDLVLFGVGKRAPKKQRAGIGMYHMSWQVDTIDELWSARQMLEDRGVLIGEAHHGGLIGIYGRDPDNLEFEISWMLPRDEWPNGGEIHLVSDLEWESEIQKWTGISTA